MAMILRTLLARVLRPALAALALCSPAQAASTLATAPVQADTFVCTAVNVGSGTIRSVTIDVVNSGNGLIVQTGTCSDVAPNRECVTSVPTMINPVRAYCRITPSAAVKSVRGNLISFLGSSELIQDAR
jgi:hypothetical protein